MNSGLSHIAAERPLILCIDDGEIALRVRKLLLDSAGYDVLTANSAEVGFELFKRHSVSLVIADHYLSAKTATEIVREMKELKPAVPILIFSGAMEPPSLEFADDFLSKGQEPKLLLDTIVRLLAK